MSLAHLQSPIPHPLPVHAQLFRDGVVTALRIREYRPLDIATAHLGPDAGLDGLPESLRTYSVNMAPERESLLVLEDESPGVVAVEAFLPAICNRLGKNGRRQSLEGGIRGRGNLAKLAHAYFCEPPRFTSRRPSQRFLFIHFEEVHVQIARGFDPILVHRDGQGPHQPQATGRIGKDAHHVSLAFYFFVEALQHIGRFQVLVMLDRQWVKRQRFRCSFRPSRIVSDTYPATWPAWPPMDVPEPAARTPRAIVAGRLCRLASPVWVDVLLSKRTRTVV